MIARHKYVASKTHVGNNSLPHTQTVKVLGTRLLTQWLTSSHIEYPYRTVAQLLHCLLHDRHTAAPQLEEEEEEE